MAWHTESDPILALSAVSVNFLRPVDFAIRWVFESALFALVWAPELLVHPFMQWAIRDFVAFPMGSAMFSATCDELPFGVATYHGYAFGLSSAILLSTVSTNSAF